MELKEEPRLIKAKGVFCGYIEMENRSLTVFCRLHDVLVYPANTMDIIRVLGLK